MVSLEKIVPLNVVIRVMDTAVSLPAPAQRKTAMRRQDVS